MSEVIALAPGAPSYRQRTVLEGRIYTLDLAWSQREARWYLDLRSADDTLVAGSIPVVPNWPLLRDLRGIFTGLPPGDLVALDGRRPPAPPGLDELGTTVPLIYLTAAELRASSALEPLSSALPLPPPPTPTD